MRALVAVAAAALVVPVASGGAGGSGSGAGLLFGTKGRILRIAADGGRVAIATEARDGKSCDRIVVWNVATGRFNAYKTGVDCGDNPVIEYLDEVALAGTRVAWIEAAGGNELELLLRTAIPGKKPATVDFAANDQGAAGGLAGDYVGNVYGDGGLIAYNTWSIGDDEQTVTSAALRIIASGKGKTIRRGEAALDVVGVDAKRIAVQQDPGPATIVSNTGGVLRTIQVEKGALAGEAFQGRTYVALRGNGLEVYDVATGKLDRAIPVPAKARLDDVQDGLAVYRNGTGVDVVRLSDGRQATFPAPSAAVGAALEGPGLFYAYNRAGGSALGRVVFVPRTRLDAALG